MRPEDERRTPLDGKALEGLSAIKKPLEFASKNSFSNLPRVRDLGSLIPSVIETSLSLPSLSENNLLKELQEKFTGFDRLTADGKKALITDALRRLEDLASRVIAETDGAPENDRDKAPLQDTSAPNGALDRPVQFVKGVGPKTAAILNRRGIQTLEDLLYLFPNRYDDRREIRKIARLEPGAIQQTTGDVLLRGEVPLGRSRKKIYEVVIGDGSGTLNLKWFHYKKAYMEKIYEKGTRILVSGEVKLFGGAREIIHPEVERIEKGEEEREGFRRILPVYPLTEGLTQKRMKRIMEDVLAERSNRPLDAIPQEIAVKRGLEPIGEAMRSVHFPPGESDITRYNEKRSGAHRRLVYDEFFFLELGIACRKRNLEIDKGVSIDGKNQLKKRFLKNIPFGLTSAQQRVIAEIERDLLRPYPMHRLLQGDVGCGKTIVALIASLNAVDGGYQVAFMAPTEILAEQHFINIHRYTQDLGVEAALVTGSTKGSEKSGISERTARGEIDIVIGTHAIIQDGFSFRRLGLGVIDEQHRFGVVQRARLKEMGPPVDNGRLTPNILVMSATPIPRSLAMTVYGDLELSVIDELPPGREKIETKVYHEKERPKVYEIIRDELKKGRQAYIVCPLVEESEKTELRDATGTAENLSRVFDGFRVGLIHGRLKVDEKETVMDAFKSGEIDILVATTVIEVGIDVPNATVMVIEHAERFGLSQLHQLRGRVGRGGGRSVCILLAQYNKSDEARRRLKVMEESTDGFDIAEADLSLRGPGDFLGTRQSGMPDFRIGNILRDEKILKAAREDALRLIENDPSLARPAHQLIKAVMLKRWKGRLGLAGVG